MLLERGHGIGVQADRPVAALRLARGDGDASTGRDYLLADLQRPLALGEAEPRRAEQFTPASTGGDSEPPEGFQTIPGSGLEEGAKLGRRPDRELGPLL